MFRIFKCSACDEKDELLKKLQEDRHMLRKSEVFNSKRTNWIKEADPEVFEKYYSKGWMKRCEAYFAAKGAQQ